MSGAPADPRLATPAVSAGSAAGRCAAPAGWVDIHAHLLPGLDDGPADMDAALALAGAMVADGVTHAAATPHQFGRYAGAGRGETIRRVFAEFSEAVSGAGLPLTLYAGADARIDGELIDGLSTGEAVTLADAGRYVLIEPPHEVWIEPGRLLGALDAAGVVGVLTHPERHRAVQAGRVDLEPWVRGGVVLQVTAGSLLGGFGREAKRVAWTIVESGVAAVVASDAHSVDGRPPCLGAAASVIASRLGPEVSSLLCRENPWAMLESDAPPVRGWRA